MIALRYLHSTATTPLRRTLLSSNTARSFASDSENLIKTSLYDWHIEQGGDMVPFAGYSLPVLYKNKDDSEERYGVKNEHLWCRSLNKASLFDVSHMGQVCCMATASFAFCSCP